MRSAYDVTCPECNGRSVIVGEPPKHCSYCGKTLPEEAVCEFSAARAAGQRVKRGGGHKTPTSELAQREIWNYRDASRVLNVSVATIRTLRESGEIDGFEVATPAGRTNRYVKAASARAWVDRQCAKSAVSARMDSRAAAHMFRLNVRREIQTLQHPRQEEKAHKRKKSE